MTTGSLCLTLILKSRKPCSSNRLASHSADSTSASGVALPYLASSRLSREPALTPIRIEVPRSPAAWAICLTWSSKARMLPGLTRTAAQPASIAAKTYFGWKWMSAITGICDLVAMAGSASASSWLGTATRTMSHPVAVSSAICCSVALMSAVSVVVIDCTLTGASPPTSTLPTLIWRVVRRGARVGGGSVGRPRSMLMGPVCDEEERPPRYRVTPGRTLRTRAVDSAPDLGEHPADRLQGAVARPPRSVRQLETEIRSTARPRQVEGVIHAVPSASSRRATSRVTSSGPNETQTWV